MRPTAFFAASFAAMLGSGNAVAADAAQGEVLAKRWCAACHVVAEGQNSATPDVPGFASIGRRPGFDEMRVAYFLLSPHPSMPSMALSRAEAADLAAYIRSQANR
jgi:mono/diheme cytochrome c family protein